MADNKDFLSQFSESNKKPESFKEEERIPVSKPKKSINPLMIIIPSVLAVVIIAVLVFVFLFPHIKVESFVGKPQSDAAAWIKQNEIESAGIVFKEEYSFDVAKGNVVSQIPESGKVKKNAKMTFVISKGADPDESIVLPDIKNMTKSEIENWISENKLSATKINTTYSDTVAKDEVISFDLSVDTDKFTRGTTLKINISKGPAPAGTIKVEDFSKKDYSYVETWAKSKKVTLKKVEAYSDDVISGYVISQSIAADKEMKEGETLTVTVSKGKGVTVPNFLKMSESEYNTWKETNTGENLIQVKEKVYYSTSDSYVIKQSVSAGTTIAQSEVVIVTINKGDGFYLNEALTALGYDYVEGATSYDRLDDWSYKAKEIGLNAQVHMYTGNYAASDKPKGTILKIEYAKDEDGNKYSMNEKLPLDVRIFCSVSSGELDKDEYKIAAEDLSALNSDSISYESIKSWVDSKSEFGFGIEEEHDSTITSSSYYKVIGFKYQDSYENKVIKNKPFSADEKIPYGAVLVISDNSYTPPVSPGAGSGA